LRGVAVSPLRGGRSAAVAAQAAGGGPGGAGRCGAVHRCHAAHPLATGADPRLDRLRAGVRIRRPGRADDGLLAHQLSPACARELGELAEAQRDVTAIVTHELAAPLGAIRRLVDTVGTGELSPPEQGRAMIMIEAEAGMLSALVADIQSLAVADRAEFPVDPQPVRLSELVRTAAVFAESLPGYHPLQAEITDEECEVIADSGRIAQVL